jgi:hypothetical protein
MPIPLISRTNTIDEWRVQTNLEATALNNLESGNFTKSNGSLSLTGSSALVITANGTALQVANGALFQSNVTVAGDIALGTQGSATGNLTTGGIVTVLAPGNALQVANNATVNTDLQVTRTIYTGNVSANGNVTVGGNETVSGILRLPGSGNVLYVNNGVAVVKTLSATDVNTTNADISLATIGEAAITEADISIGNIGSANASILTSNSASLNYSTLSNTTITKADIVSANITTKLNVQNALITVRGTSAFDDALTITRGKATVQDVVIEGNLTVVGIYTQTGNSNIEVDTLTLNSNTGVNKDALIVNRRISGNNAILRWVETDKSWKISKGNTYTSLNNIIDASYVDTTVNNASDTQVASASAVKLTYDTSILIGAYANGAFRSQNTTGVYANAAFALANTALEQGGVIAGGYANSAFTRANTANTNAATADQKAVSAGVYANSAFAAANVAAQRAVTSGSYANSAYAHANTKFASAGGTISGDVVVSGNLTISGETTYVNTTNMLFADAILTLNSDYPTTASPTENAGIEIQRGTSSIVVLRWNETNDKWEFTNDGTFYGDIAGVYQVQAAGTYANAAFAAANTAFESGGIIAGGYANSAFTRANTATTNAATADQRAVTSGSYANSAFTRANTATTNAATADQRAVTSGSYANSAFAAANSKVASITSGTGVTVGGTSTIPTVSIGQAVATSSSVRFNSIGVGTAATGTTGEIRATNNIVAYYSDDRLKTKLGNIDDALNKLMTLSGFYYEANQTAQDLGYEPIREVGVSAQQVQAVMPEVVAPAPIDNKYLTVQYERLVPLIIESIKELKNQLDELKGV